MTICSSPPERRRRVLQGSQSFNTWVFGGELTVWVVRGEVGTKGTTATESLDVSVTLPVPTMTHWHAHCSDVALPLPLLSQRLLSQTTALFERIQKQTTRRGGPRENHHHSNLLCRHPPPPSARMVAAREPRRCWRNLVGEAEPRNEMVGSITFTLNIFHVAH